MSVVISRKGFDSGWGGYPSPIFPSDEMISFPIPDTGMIEYKKLMLSQGISFEDLMRQLKITQLKRPKQYGPLMLDAATCHLDPDLREKTLERHPDWRPIYGQSDNPQSELATNNVGKGSLFIFFGRFQKVKPNENKNQEYIYDKKVPQKHVIYGYLHVDEVISLSSDEGRAWIKENTWASYHPHVIYEKWKEAGVNLAVQNNTLYVASRTLEYNGKVLPGAATFRFHPKLVLSSEKLSKWHLPEKLHPTKGNKYTRFHFPAKDGKKLRWSEINNGYCKLDTHIGPWQEIICLGENIKTWAYELISSMELN